MNIFQTTPVFTRYLSTGGTAKTPVVQSGLPSISEWVTEINAQCEREKGGTIELAKMLYAAKRQLQKGQWTELWKSGLIPFRQTSAHLPSGRNILYQLARLDRPVLENLIADGAVHRALTLSQARALVAKFNGSDRKKSSHHELKQWLCKIKNLVIARLESLSARERKLMQSQFIDLAKQIALRANHTGLIEHANATRTAESAGEICPTAILVVEGNAPPLDRQIIQKEVINTPSAVVMAEDL